MPAQTDISAGMSVLGNDLEDVATEFAKKDAAEDLRKQVTLDANGRPQLNESPFTPYLGKAGAVYNATLQQGLAATMESGQSQAMTDLHQQAKGDPGVFEKSATAFLQAQRDKYPGQLGEALFENGLGLLARHYSSLSNEAAAQTVANSKQSMLTRITDSESHLEQLAINGQQNTEDFAKTSKSVETWRNELASNPAYGISREKADSAAADLTSRLKVLSYQSGIQEARDTGKLTYDQIDGELQRMRDDPSSSLGSDERNRLYLAGKARLDQTSQAQQANARAIRTTTDAFEKSFADPSAPKPTKADIDTLADSATKNGAPDAFYRLQKMSESYEVLRSMTGLTPAQKMATLMGGAVGPVTPDAVHAAIIGQESGGNPNAPSSVTGAAGIGQIQPDTFRRYAKPGESISNPADNLAVSRRIVADLYQKAGGDPARVAVGYFSGPGNIAPPGSPTPYVRDAADPTGKTTSSYVSDVMRRISGGGGAQTGIPYTPQQIADNPLIASTYIQASANNAARMKQLGQQIGTGIVSAYEGGHAPGYTDLAMFRQIAADHPADLGNLSRKVEDLASVSSAAKRLAPDAPASNAAIAAADAYASANPGIAAAQHADITRKMLTSEQKRFEEDPISWAAANGYAARAPQPLNLGNPQAVADEFAHRAAAVAHLPPTAGLPSAVSLLLPGESDGVKQLFGTAGTDALRVGFLNGLSRSGASPADITKTMAGLGKGADTASLAVAGMLTTRDSDAAKKTAYDIVAGQSALQAEPNLSPTKGSDRKSYDADLAGKMPVTDFPPGENRSALESAIEAVYAIRSKDANDLSGAYDPKRLDAAVEAVTGGIRDWRGSKVFAPNYGDSQDRLDATVRSLTDQDFATARLPNGQPFPATALKPSIMTTFSTQPWRLESVDGAPGRYYVVSGPDDHRIPLRDATTGRSFMLDLSSKSRALSVQPQPSTGYAGAWMAPFVSATDRSGKSPDDVSAPIAPPAPTQEGRSASTAPLGAPHPAEPANYDIGNKPPFRLDDNGDPEPHFLEEKGQTAILPTLGPDGHGGMKELTDAEAVAQYRRTGKHLGKFKTLDDAYDAVDALSGQWKER